MLIPWEIHDLNYTMHECLGYTVYIWIDLKLSYSEPCRYVYLHTYASVSKSDVINYKAIT
jgi:hypothetical protein